MTARIKRKRGCAKPNRTLQAVDRPPRSINGAFRPIEGGATWRERLGLNSLRNRLILLISLPLLLLQLAVVGLEYAIGRGTELAELEDTLRQRTQLAALDIDNLLALTAEVGKNTALQLADNVQFDDYQRHRTLRSGVETHPLVYSASAVFEPWITKRLPLVYRPTGNQQRIESIDLNRPDYDIRRQSWYRRARSVADPFWIGPYQDNVTQSPLVSCVTPMFRNGGFAGTIVVSLKAETLQSRLARNVRDPFAIYLVDGASHILVALGRDTPATSLIELAETEREPRFHDIARRIAAAETGLTRFDGINPAKADRLVAFMPVPTNSWAVLSQVDQAEALDEINRRLIRQSAFYGLGTLGILMLVGWSATVTTRPLRNLAIAARDVAKGNLDTRLREPLPNDEIGQFSRVFNTMVGDLKSNIEARLEETAARQVVESELDIALQIQRSLLPKAYTGTPAIDLAGTSIPAHYVAGDFYDWFELDEDTLGIVIADVSGKGVPAALFMAVARTSLRTFGNRTHGPGETLNALNRALFEDNPLVMFVTAFYAHYHVQSGRLVYANAGHNVPYVVRTNSGPEPLGTSTGRLLGVFPDAGVTEAETELRPGECLVLYTDGVTDASDPEGRFFDEKRLELVLNTASTETARGICSRVGYAVGDHCHGAIQDDVTLVVLKRNV